jgi:hypothetical protein
MTIHLSRHYFRRDKYKTIDHGRCLEFGQCEIHLGNVDCMKCLKILKINSEKEPAIRPEYLEFIDEYIRELYKKDFEEILK